MKTFLSVLVVIIFVHFSFGFLPFPLVDELLEPFLNSLNIRNKEFDKNIIEKAVKGEECMRKCHVDDRKVCYFNFTLKHYQVMSGLVKANEFLCYHLFMFIHELRVAHASLSPNKKMVKIKSSTFFSQIMPTVCERRC